MEYLFKKFLISRNKLNSLICSPTWSKTIYSTLQQNIWFKKKESISWNYCSQSMIWKGVLSSYLNPAVVHFCGTMLRECIHYRSVFLYLLKHLFLFKHLISDYFLFENADIASEIVLLFKELLLSHKECMEKRFALPVSSLLLFDLRFSPFCLVFFVQNIHSFRKRVWWYFTTICVFRQHPSILFWITNPISIRFCPFCCRRTEVLAWQLIIASSCSLANLWRLWSCRSSCLWIDKDSLWLLALFLVVAVGFGEDDLKCSECWFSTRKKSCRLHPTKANAYTQFKGKRDFDCFLKK